MHRQADTNKEFGQDAEVSRTRNTIGATDLVVGLINGQWTLLGAYDSDGKRVLLMRRTQSTGPAEPLLSAVEQRVLLAAGMGHDNARIASMVRVDEEAVAGHLLSAANKLLIDEVDLMRLAVSLNCTVTSPLSGDATPRIPRTEGLAS